jgi:hypothetical protein
MRVSTTALFQGLDGLRRTVDELQDALKASNDKVVRLARRVKFLEDRLSRLTQDEPFQSPELNRGLQAD